LRFFFNVLSIGIFYIRVPHSVVPSSRAIPVIEINNIEPQIAFAWKLKTVASDRRDAESSHYRFTQSGEMI
jgi:hypothetical protein